MYAKTSRIMMNLLYYAALVWFIGICLSKVNISNDFYFLYATGKEIAENRAIPETNPFFIFKNMPFDIQQWLYCVYCYFLGECAVLIPIMIIALGTVLVFVLFKLFRLKDFSRKRSLFISLAAVSLCSDYMINIRPECITVILLLIQVYFLEKQIIKPSKALYFALPILMLLEINLHSSMWFMHYCLLIPYVLPFFKKPASLKVKDIIVPAMLMTVSMFINPCGDEILAYVFRSLTDDTFKIIKISEMLPVWCYLSYTLAALSAAVIAYYSYKRGYPRAVSIYIFLGLFVLIIAAIRNSMFVPILAFYLFGDFPKDFNAKEHFKIYHFDPLQIERISRRFRPHIKKLKLLLTSTLALVSLLLTVYGAYDTVKSIDRCMAFAKENDFKNSKTQGFAVNEDMFRIIDWLNANAKKDARICNPVNIGGFLEVNGFYNLFGDTRPELYNYEGSGLIDDMTALEEMCTVYGYTVDKEGLNEKIELSEKIIEAYDFDYIITEKDKVVSNVLEESTEYTKINMDYGNGGYMIYEKCK